MKKSEFFTEKFLNECEEQLIELYQKIKPTYPVGYPVEVPDDKTVELMRFYNRIYWLLFKGGRLSYDEYKKGTFLFY